MSIALSTKSGDNPKNSDPNVKKMSDPGVKKVSDPGIKKMSDPGVKKVSDPGVKKMSNSSLKKTSDPSVKKMSDSSVKKTSDPSVKEMSDSSVKKISNPSVKNESDVSDNKMSDSSAKKMSDSSAKKMSEHSARSDNVNTRLATGSFTGSSSSRTDPLSVSSYTTDPQSGSSNRIKKGEADAVSPTNSDQYDLSHLSQAYSAIRSVLDLNVGGYCDPNDPCCMKPDPERLLNKSLLRAQSRKHCAPKNPFHFEYTILHRLKLKQKLQAMAVQQFSGLITGVGAKSPEEHAVSLAQSAKSILSKGSKYTRKASKSKVRMRENEEDDDEGGSSAFPQKQTVITPEDLQEFLDGLSFGSMALAHEIALNKDFKFCKPNKPITKSAQIALDAKDKYWQKIDQFLIKRNNQNSGNKERDIEKENEFKAVVIDVVCVLKKMLLATILPNNPKMRMRIEKNLSMREIFKQIDEDTFDFRNLMAFVLDTLSVLCCPVRDQEIIVIRDMVMDDVPFSRQIKKALDLMEDMNLDMANFIIRQSRPLLIQNCVMYEREQFALYIEQRYQSGVDPIPVTRDWITRNRGPLDSPFSEVMSSAFLEILMNDSDEANANPPETLILDWPRFPKIRQEVQRVILIGAMISSVFDYVTSLDTNSSEEGTSTFGKFRLVNRLREELNPLIHWEDMACPQKLQKALDNCSNLAVQVADHYLTSELCDSLQSSQKDEISSLFKSLTNKNNSDRQLYTHRIRDWFIQVAKKEGAEPIKSPADLQIIAPLILDPITEMIRLVMYNRSVFDVLYKEIYLGNCPPPKFNKKLNGGKSKKTLKTGDGRSKRTVLTEDGKSKSTLETEAGRSKKTLETGGGKSKRTMETEGGKSKSTLETEAGRSKKTIETEGEKSKKTLETDDAKSKSTLETEAGRSKKTLETGDGKSKRTLETEGGKSKSTLETEAGRSKKTLETEGDRSKGTLKTGTEEDDDNYERQILRESLFGPGYGPPMKDEGLEKLVKKLKDFNERSMTYRRSRIDPQIQPMYNPDGTLIVPPEQQQLVRTEMTPLQQKHYDEYLLSTEPTVEADYEGLYDDNVMANDPNWLLDQTSEQLLRLMERENIIKANKLKRIKKRMERDMVNQRIANDFPVFEKIWREELGSLQKEFCRLQRIERKGNPHLPNNAQDEPRPKRVFKGACEVVEPEGEKEPPKFNEKGERIIYSRNRGHNFSEQSLEAGGSQTGVEADEPDFSQFAPDFGDDDEGGEGSRRKKSM